MKLGYDTCHIFQAKKDCELGLRYQVQERNKRRSEAANKLLREQEQMKLEHQQEEAAIKAIKNETLTNLRYATNYNILIIQLFSLFKFIF